MHDEPPPFFPHSGDTAERDVISEILDQQLFLTNYRGAASREQCLQLGITHIVSVGAEFVGASPLEGITYWYHAVDDDEAQAQHLASALEDACNFLQSALQARGGRALVHCAAGISRSATVVLAFLMLRRDYSLRRAFELVYARRRVIWPNDGFMGTLIRIEEDRVGAATMALDEYMRWGDFDTDAYTAARVIDRPPGGPGGCLASSAASQSPLPPSTSAVITASATGSTACKPSARPRAAGVQTREQSGGQHSVDRRTPPPQPQFAASITDVQPNYKIARAEGGGCVEIYYVRKTSMRQRAQWSALSVGDRVEITLKHAAGRAIVSDVVPIRGE